MQRLMVLAAAMVTAALVGCGDSDRPRQQAGEDGDTAARRGRPAPPEDSIGRGVPAPRDPSRPAGSVGRITDTEIVVATLNGRSIELSRDTVPAGEVTVVVQNKAEALCNFEVTSQSSGRWRSPVAPGRTVQMSMVLDRSPYRLFCVAGGSTRPPTRDTVRLLVR